MSGLRYVVGLAGVPAARRLPGSESVAAQDQHAVLESESVARCGAPIAIKLPENFEQSIGVCRRCLELVLAEDQ
jgi:hypothetical protein